MAARIVHFGVDSCHRLWVLKNAGYSVDDCQSVVQLRAALQSGTHADAVAFTESERFAPDEVVEVTRAHSSAPLILFRETLGSYRNWPARRQVRRAGCASFDRTVCTEPLRLRRMR